MTAFVTRACLAFCLLTLLCSCSNLGEKRSLLAAAGFRTIPAVTPAQIAKLESLPANRLTPLNGKSGTVYIFPDTSKHNLLVGGPVQFQKYRVLKAKRKLVDEKLLDAQVNMDNADWSAWGPDANWGFEPASAP